MDVTPSGKFHELGLTELAILPSGYIVIPTRDRSIKKDGFIVPASKPLHEKRINAVNHYAGDNFQDIFDCRSAWTGMGLIVYSMRKKAAKTGFPGFLNKDIAMICLPAHSREDHWYTLLPVEARGRNPRWIVVHANNGNASQKINALLECVLKTKAIPLNKCVAEAFFGKISGQAAGFVFVEVAFVEALSIKIGWLHNIIIKNDKLANALAYQRLVGLAQQASGTN